MSTEAALLTGQMLKALTAAEEAIDEAAEIMFYEDGQPVTALESWEIERVYFALCGVLVEVREAIDACGQEPGTAAAGAPGNQSRSMNQQQVGWAQAAIAAFRQQTGTDLEDALGDLLCDLMHWSAQNNFDFQAALDRARGQYEVEIIEDN